MVDLIEDNNESKNEENENSLSFKNNIINNNLKNEIICEYNIDNKYNVQILNCYEETKKISLLEMDNSKRS